MYKSVSFNIFEENLEDIVYREDSGFQKQKDELPEKYEEKITRKSTEIIIKPLVDLRPERDTERN